MSVVVRPALTRLVAAFQARHPASEVRLQEVETFDAYRPLRRGDIDVLCNWLAVDEPDLTAGAAFAHYPRALAVAGSHRLAGNDTVSVEELADEQVALLPVHPSAATSYNSRSRVRGRGDRTLVGAEIDLAGGADPRGRV